MIIGIGIDIIEVDRVQNIAERNLRFLKKIFTPDEIKYCMEKKNKFQHLAARFAAKEAFFKAIGRRIGWTEVSLINLPSGKPQLQIKSEEKFSFKKADVSVSHLKDYAVATVILSA